MNDTPDTDAQDQRPIRVVIKRPDGATTHYIPADFARKLERERNNLQDQRDFAMSEIERLRKERDKFRHALRAIARMDTSRANARSLLSVAVAKHAVEESFNGVSSPVKHNATNALILDYEIRSSRFAGFMFGNFLQGIAARYFAWKVSSKMGRYIANKQSSAQLL